ncbi:SIR2 family protein [Polyangium jinanense]|uniref:SIR2 family protein n=1 Tax=Polyangium jinanense TaxID=2829994 RepID=A0A9X3XJG1_9BACT|nr:SIR2 family protein [Polyangium jinanense]MDC3958829.1 SIR2 family protein [Polyangium jinanense]MDC3989191.1 SIR2 family protein [Polyangium jinanense]
MADADITSDLGRELAAGRAVLFTGAGFSVDARAEDGSAIPSGPELSEELWDLCFPGESRDGSALQDLFQHALSETPDKLEALLRRRLTVDPARLPAFYRVWFALPWRRIYTLNVDDLATAAEARFDLPRPVVIRAALADDPPPDETPDGSRLEVVHLNGHVTNGPRGVTFSTTQYGARLASDKDPHYAALVRDFCDLPFVFVGTRLDESPLWQELERVERTGGEEPQRPRPRSLLVTPQIERARQCLLERIGVAWVPLSTRQFTDEVLFPIARSLGVA